jgi:hypothetical protein
VFTGSTEIGTRVMAGAAEQIKRVTLELGGKSANIVFDDCDLERAAATAPYGVFDNAGQDCCARSRILVQRSVFDKFMELLEPAVKGVVVGDPAHRDTEMGPLVSRPHWESVASYVPDDAPIAFRGSAPQGPGYWFPPTVLTPDRADRTVTEEIFGPVVAVLQFEDEADAIALANATDYGLATTVWTQDLGKAHRMAAAIDSAAFVQRSSRVEASSVWAFTSESDHFASVTSSELESVVCRRAAATANAFSTFSAADCSSARHDCSWASMSRVELRPTASPSRAIASDVPSSTTSTDWKRPASVSHATTSTSASSDCSERSTRNCMNINTIDNASAVAVVSNAVPSPATTPEMFSSWVGERLAIATVMPMTVPRNPMIGIAQITYRTSP